MSAGAAPWRIVAAHELRRLWLGPWGPLVLFVFSIALSAYVVVLAADPELNVLTQRMLVAQTIQLVELAGIVAVALVAASAFSGERDRGSLEGLLLAPVARGQLVIGKAVAAFSVWLGMLAIAMPYVALVAKGSGLGIAALALLVLGGTLLVGLSAAVGVFASALAPTNLASFATVAGLLLVLAAPTQLPAGSGELPVVAWLVAADPFTAVERYQAAVLDGAPWVRGWWRLGWPLAAVLIAFGVTVRVLDRRLSLHGGFGA